MLSKILLLFIFLSSIHASDYDKTHIKTCSSVAYSLELRNVFILHSYDELLIKIISPFSFLACIITIFIYIKFKSTRQQPGDIILALAISQIFMLISFLATVIYNAYYPVSESLPANFLAFCQATGYIYSLSFSTQFIYNICFCAYFVMRIKNVLKSLDNIKYLIHIICLCLLGVVAIILYLTNLIGVSLFGYCGFKVSAYSPYFRSSLILVYFICLTITIIYFRKYVPKIKNNELSRRKFLKYYYRYNFAISINLIIQSIFNLISALNCNSFTPNPSLQIFLTLSNISILTTPFIFLVVIAWHPQVRKSFRACFSRLVYGKSEDIQITQQQTKRNVQMTNNNYRYFQNILQTTKSSLIYTILLSLYLQDYQSQGFETYRRLNQWNHKDRVTFQINQNSCQKTQNVYLNQFRIMNAHVTAYAPRAFKTLMHYDGYFNFKKHINPKLNQIQIKKCTQSSGGKSGQFFFFTYDNKLILKTLKAEELKILLQRLQKYIDHFIDNQHSLIVKIYGIYTFVNLNTQQQYHILVMKNISGCSRKYIERVYDLKGSKFDRQVLKSYTQTPIRVRQTMKDIDFRNLQKKLFIDAQQSQKIKQILISDSQFLMSQGLIDYSLIIMKIQISEYLQQNNLTRQQFLNNQSNPYSYILSNQNSNLAYAIGIIDYLQTWNAKKKSQKFTKKIVFRTKASEISAQSPEKYAQRFRRDLINIIF